MRRAIMKRGKAMADRNLLGDEILFDRGTAPDAEGLLGNLRWFADNVACQQEKMHWTLVADEIEALHRDLKAHEDHLDDLVQERLEEINAEAEAYDRDATNTLTKLCEACPGFDWRDYQDGLTIQDAYDFLTEDRTAQEDHVNRLQQRAGELQEALGEVGALMLKAQMQEPTEIMLTWRGECFNIIGRIIPGWAEGQALHQEPGEGGGGEKCPRGCKDGWIIAEGSDGEERWRCPFHPPAPHPAHPKQAQEGEDGGREPCKRCGGTRMVTQRRWEGIYEGPCPECGPRRVGPLGKIVDPLQPCAACGGHGQIDPGSGAACPICDGSGKEPYPPSQSKRRGANDMSWIPLQLIMLALAFCALALSFKAWEISPLFGVGGFLFTAASFAQAVIWGIRSYKDRQEGGG